VLALGEPAGFADVADGARVAVLDERTDHRRVLSRVSLDDVAEHPVTRLTPEGEVDIGYVGLRAVLAQEALHRQVVLDGVDAGKPEQEADEGAHGGATAAHRQVVFVSVTQDVPEAEEESSALAGLNQPELLIDAVLDVV